MKIARLSFLVLVSSLACALGQEGTNSTRRVSVAEVGGVRLEVEQPLHESTVLIRVRDYAADARQKQRVSCDVYCVGEDGGETRIKRVKLRRASPTASDYSGSASDQYEFPHGTIIRVVYKSYGLRLPISTWHAFYYH